jgi:hypothetical protein
MVEDIQKLGELLKLPNLDDETIKLINSKMRELIGAAQVQPPLDLTTDIMNEYLYGKKEGE